MKVSIGLASDVQVHHRSVNRHFPIDDKLALVAFLYVRLLAGVRQFSRDGLQKIGARNNSLQCAVLINDNANANGLRLETLDSLQDRRELREYQWLLQNNERINFSAFKRLVEQVLFSQHADDFVDTPLPDHDVLMRAVTDYIENFVPADIRVRPNHTRPRRHD